MYKRVKSVSRIRAIGDLSVLAVQHSIPDKKPDL